MSQSGFDFGNKIADFPTVRLQIQSPELPVECCSSKNK